MIYCMDDMYAHYFYPDVLQEYMKFVVTFDVFASALYLVCTLVLD